MPQTLTGSEPPSAATRSSSRVRSIGGIASSFPQRTYRMTAFLPCSFQAIPGVDSSSGQDGQSFNGVGEPAIGALTVQTRWKPAGAEDGGLHLLRRRFGF